MPKGLSEKYPDVSVPEKTTLKKYGITQEEWVKILEKQGGVCFICKSLSKTGRLVTDHEHVPGYKKKPDKERASKIRGLLCWMCNHYYVGRGITIEKAKNVVSYLENYKQRQPC